MLSIIVLLLAGVVPLLIFVLTDSLIIALAAAVLGSVLTFMFRRRLFYGGMVRILKELKQLGSENLIFASFAAKGHDDLWGELAKELDSLFGNIRHMIRELQITSEQTTSSAESLAANMQHVEAAAQTMTANLQSVFAGLSGQTATVRSVVEVAERNVAANEDELAKRIQGVQQLASFAQGIGTLFNRLTEQTKRVDSITKTIDEIADQINILSINASIEAALAGDKGKGFAVLAGEVRELAERATAATEDTRKILESIKSDIGKVGSEIDENQRIAKRELMSIEAARGGLSAMSKSISQVAESVSLFVEESGGKLANADTAVQEQGQAISAVSERTEEVSRQVERVYQALANFGGLQTGAQAMQTQINEARAEIEQLAVSADISSMSVPKHTAILSSLVPRFTLGFTANTAGDIIAITEAVSIKNIGFRSYFRSALAGKAYVSDVYISTANNMPCVTISAAIRREGVVVGVIGVDMTLEVKVGQHIKAAQEDDKELDMLDGTGFTTI